MKRINLSKGLVVYLLVILYIFPLLNSCSKWTNVTTIDTKEIPGTEKKTGTKIYTFETINLPTPYDPEFTIKVLEGERYSIETKSKYQGYKRPSKFSMIIFSILGGTGAGLIGANISMPSDFYWGEGYVIGFGCWALAGLVGIISDGGSNQKYFTKHSESKFFSKDYHPLVKTDISVICKSQHQIYQTDGNGLIRINPAVDFNLVSSSNNDPINFDFKYNNIDFITSLCLNPKLWMHHYGRVIVSECAIVVEPQQAKSIARKGMEFKIVEYNNLQKKYKVELFNNKMGWINADLIETHYSLPKKSDLTQAIKTYVEERINSWQQQGEFESLSVYKQRILSRNDKLKDFTVEAMDLFQQDYIQQIDWRRAVISRYDPNSQTFKVTIPDLQEIIISIPIEKAQSFKENWDKVIIKNQKFVLIDGKWELSYLDLENPFTKCTGKFDSKMTNLYDPTNQFAFNLTPIVIDLPSQRNEIINETNNKISDNYSINTNLPISENSRPDAIAVIIGNSNYSYTDPVVYAINDAQLVKVYLTNVIGYKPENIIFVKNATKGELDGLFGTKDNFKGRLYNYVKPGVSDVFIYYSGHGAPGINDRKGYFVPIDCDPLLVELQGYPLDQFYENLVQIPAKSTVVVLDACFSGAGVLKNISSIRIKPVDNLQKIKNGVIVTSSTADEVSSWYSDKQHGLFTYFFLKAIHDYKSTDKNADGKLSFQEIYNYLSDNSNGVPYFARRLNKVEQHPTLQGTDKDGTFVIFK